jgi:alkylhydroperoxidase family enzyme
MTGDAPRIEPLAADEWSGEVQELLGGVPVGDADPYNIFTTLARHPKLLKRWFVFGAHVLYKSTLEGRDRELLILRTAWRCQAEYEWGHHAAIARQVGLTDDEIVRVTKDASAGWSEREAWLLRAADELHDDQRIGDETWASLLDHYDEQHLLDIVFTVGQYTTVSMALRTLGVQLEDQFEGFPEQSPG